MRALLFLHLIQQHLQVLVLSFGEAIIGVFLSLPEDRFHVLLLLLSYVKERLADESADLFLEDFGEAFRGLLVLLVFHLGIEVGLEQFGLNYFSD